MTVKARSISCPNCGGPVELRGFSHTLSVVCPQCLSVIDASTPELQILKKFREKQRVHPKIPLGSRGKIDNTMYELIGFQQREVGSGGDIFCWDEYLLFNPYQGFRYLTEYQGHWNFVRVLHALPEPSRAGGKLAVRLENRTFIHFDTLTAKTGFVLGEFPWQVKVGDAVECRDYIAPPLMLSSEGTSGEITWSRAEYMPGTQIWKAFQLPDSPPYPSGIFANQPSPYKGKVGSAWRTWLWLNVALALIFLYFSVISPGREVFKQSYNYSPSKTSDASFVTPPFQLTGRASNAQVAISTDLDNSWALFNLALINEDTGQAFDFPCGVSYYHDSDGTEGSRSNSVIVPAVPSGKYYLRVEPELDSAASHVNYQLAVRRDVPNNVFFWIAAVLMLIPPIVKSARSASFEAQRWRESDYAPAGSGSDSSGDGGGDDD